MILEIAAVIVVLHLIIGLILYNHVKILKGRPGKVGFPIIGNLYYFYRSLFLFDLDDVQENILKNISNDKNDVFFHWFCGQRAVSITNPYFVEKIVYHPNLVEKPPVMFSAVRVFIDGIFSAYVADGDWKDRRRDMNNSMKKALLENSYHQVFVESAKYFADELYATRNNLEVKISSFNITMRSVLSTHTAFHPEKEVLPYGTFKIINRFLELSARSFANPLEANILMRIGKFFEPIILKNACKLLNDVTEATDKALKGLKLHKSDEEKVEWPLSMSIMTRNNERNLPFSQTAKEVYELVLAGAHTVASVITNAVFCLSVSPEVQEKAWQEQLDIFGSDDREPTPADVRNMEYLDRFLSEVLRFSGPTILAKYTTADTDIDGVFIPVGTIVLIPARNFHMDPTFWKNPEDFEPDRFLLKDNVPKYANVPFGVGPKSCPGRLYAIQEMKIVLSTLIRRLKLSSSKEFKDLHFAAHILTEVKEDIPIEVAERK